MNTDTQAANLRLPVSVMDEVVNIQNETFDELKRAMSKFPGWPTDELHALAIVQEELGEVQKDVLQQVYEPERGHDVEKEMIQALAMGMRFLIARRMGHYNTPQTFSPQIKPEYNFI